MLTRSDYTIIEPMEAGCNHATPGIVVEGPGRRGELLIICANPDCDTHGKADHRAAREAEAEQRHAEWRQRQAEREQNRENNTRLLNSTLKQIPKSLSRADYEMFVFAAIDRLEYDDLEALCGRYNIDTDELREPDGAVVALQEIARRARERQLICMLVELSLLPSGYSDERLQPTDLLVTAAERYQAAIVRAKPIRTAKRKVTVLQGKRGSKARRSKAVSR